MQSDRFDYELPSKLIAQEPCAQRDQCRLLVVRRSEATSAHHVFQELPRLLAPGDLLVLNDTRVLQARLVGCRARTGGKWEGLFLRETADGLWELLSQTRGRLIVGETIVVQPGPLSLRLVSKTTEGHWLVQPSATGSPLELLAVHGQMPLPPYIRKGRSLAADRDNYQTVYAQRAGAVAAPTAGLHFTPELLVRLEQHGIGHTFVTLHVGLGTFQPIHVEDVREHTMHQEWGEISSTAAADIANCRRRGGRVVAVGTTTVRLLETVAASGPIRPWSGETDLYIYPPYQFRVVDALITNFHLPRTSLLVLVSAFAGIDLTRQAYKTALECSYRFYSYGDAMLIV
ncbi:MAG TPA: tRNA preQ1(34) S-adenosylmethionine ribosyltransferase-isomerase QueA [Gemmataceae bacterium]|nr:tRNA preQ1(34) S-adenosylmethionine ribosyltransferase-isomerase QueA [Gemmataceae bacterium]